MLSGWVSKSKISQFHKQSTNQVGGKVASSLNGIVVVVYVVVVVTVVGGGVVDSGLTGFCFGR